MRVFLQVTHKKDYEQKDYFTYSYLIKAKETEIIQTKYADFVEFNKEEDVKKAWLQAFLNVNQWLISNEIKKSTVYIKGRKNKRLLQEAFKETNDYTRELKRLALFVDFELKAMKNDSEEIEMLNHLERELHYKRTLHQRVFEKLIKQRKLEEEEISLYRSIQEEIHNKINNLLQESQKTEKDIFKHSYFSSFNQEEMNDVTLDEYKHLKMLKDNYNFLETVNANHFKGEVYENELHKLNSEINQYQQKVRELEGEEKKKKEKIKSLESENEELKKKLEQLVGQFTNQSTNSNLNDVELEDIEFELVKTKSLKKEVQKIYKENRRFYFSGITQIVNGRYFLSYNLMNKIDKGIWLNKETMDEELNPKINKVDTEWLYLKVFYYSLKELIEKNLLKEKEEEEKPIVLRFVLPTNHYKNAKGDLKILQEVNSSHLKELYKRSNEEIDFLNGIKMLLLENNVEKVQFELR